MRSDPERLLDIVDAIERIERYSGVKKPFVPTNSSRVG